MEKRPRLSSRGKSCALLGKLSFIMTRNRRRSETTTLFRTTAFAEHPVLMMV
jgi:hypothetical protein